MTAPSAPAGPITQAVARFFRRTLGVLLLLVAIGLSSCEALMAADHEATAPAIELIERTIGAELGRAL